MKAQLLEDIGDSHPPAPQRPAHRPTVPETEAKTGAPGAEACAPPPLADPWAASEAPVWSAPAAPAYLQQEDDPDWFERWGRRTLASMVILLAMLAASGAGLWLYNENKVDQSLSVLAKAPIPARGAVPAHTQPIPLDTTQLALAASAAHKDSPAQPPPAADAPRVADIEEQHTGKQEGATARNTAPERTRKRRLAAQAAAPAAPTQARPTTSGNTPHTGQLTETLRLCRAAGYHAARCIQLGCTATQYGLACKGTSGAQR